MFAALAVPNFRRYVAGQSISLIGTWVETVAQALLVLRLTHSGTLLGLTTAARYLPVLVFSSYAGLLVDRFPRRRVLLATQLGLGLISLALGLLVLTGSVRLWQVVVLALAFGGFSAVDNPARQTFTAEVVGRELVRNAVVLNSTVVNVARVIGPAVAAVLVGTAGIGWCFVVNAVSFGFVIASLLLLNRAELHPVPPVPRAPGELRAGFRYAASVPAIARPLLMMALVGTFTFEFEVSLPLLAQRTFGGADHYSWLIGALGVGAVLGGLYAARDGRTGVRRLSLISAAYAAAVGLVAVAPVLWTAELACAATGAASVSFLTTGNATVQLAAAPSYRGRVTALWSLALVGSTAVGAPVIGALAQHTSPRYALALGAVAALAALFIGGWPHRATRPRHPGAVGSGGAADHAQREVAVLAGDVGVGVVAGGAEPRLGPVAHLQHSEGGQLRILGPEPADGAAAGDDGADVAGVPVALGHDRVPVGRRQAAHLGVAHGHFGRVAQEVQHQGLGGRP
jgi:MFS family permease